MASDAVASPVIQTELIVEDKTSFVRPWRSFNNLFDSLKLSPATAELAELNGRRPSIAESTKSCYTELSGLTKTSLGRHRSASDVSKIEFDESIIGPDDDKAGERLVDQATAFVNADEKIPDNLPRLRKPIAIPRIQRGNTSPLVRAWPLEASRHAIQSHDFIAFLDNLNVVSREPPVTTVLLIAAFAVSFVPWDGADGVAALTELSALAIAYAIVVRRCRRYIDKMNETYFHPRKLHARLIGTKRMKKSLGIAKDEPLVAPLSEETLTMTAHERCMTRMKEYTCELSHDVPEPSDATKLLQRFTTWKARYDVNRFDKMVRRFRKRAWKKHLKGKPPKREGTFERSRVKQLEWLLIQNLDEWEREEAERVRLVEEKKEKKRARGRFPWLRRNSTIDKADDLVEI